MVSFDHFDSSMVSSSLEISTDGSLTHVISFTKNRAKELRLKMKERETSGEQSSSIASSKANLQRQRRSRQLEETQRLLDGYDLNNNNNLETAPHKSDTNTDVSVASRRRAKKDRVTSSGIAAAHSSKQRDDDHANTQSVVSKEQLARIHGKYDESTSRREGGSSEKRNKEYAALSMESRVTRNGTFVETAGSSARLDDGPTCTLREQLPVEGRGRGRGRNRGTISSSHGSSLGEMSQSMKKKSPRMIETNSSRPSSEVVQSYLKYVGILFACTEFQPKLLTDLNFYLTRTENAECQTIKKER